MSGSMQYAVCMQLTKTESACGNGATVSDCVLEEVELLVTAC